MHGPNPGLNQQFDLDASIASLWRRNRAASPARLPTISMRAGRDALPCAAAAGDNHPDRVIAHKSTRESLGWRRIGGSLSILGPSIAGTGEGSRPFTRIRFSVDPD